ncbi:MAG: DUF58 domain-containing protein [Spirochaetales bacterium]|nr:DUF58 domain-containing protein [Spirochaetales bacterium]
MAVNGRPRVLIWYRAYATLLALASALGAYMLVEFAPGTEHLFAPSTGLELAYTAGILGGLLLLLVLILASIGSLWLSPEPWFWQYCLVMLGVGMVSIVLLPLALPLAIFWFRPSVRGFFQSHGHVAASNTRIPYPVELPRFLKRLEYAYPLTGAGTLLLILAIYLLGDAFAGDSINLYALVISTLSLSVLALLVLSGRLQRFRAREPEIFWDTSAPLIARLSPMGQRVLLGDLKPYYFFRVHFRMQARLEAGRDADLYLSREGASSTGGEISIPLFLPVSGMMVTRGRLLLRDVFGLTRARLGEEVWQRLPVLAPTFPGKHPVSLRNAASLESARRQRSADEEKYYMREYIPGDRLKDINWKASFRFSELITRISPKAPEESRLVHVEFRNFSRAQADSALAILHLNYLKSWLLSFLGQLKRDYPEFNFRIFTAHESAVVESEADIADFARKLATLQYARQTTYGYTVPVAFEKFVFTTPFDGGLGHSLSGEHPGVYYNVFRTAFGTGRARERSVRFFLMEEINPLPGPWIFRRDAKEPVAGVPANGRLIEERLRFRLL